MFRCSNINPCLGFMTESYILSSLFQSLRKIDRKHMRSFSRDLCYMLFAPYNEIRIFWNNNVHWHRDRHCKILFLPYEVFLGKREHLCPLHLSILTCAWLFLFFYPEMSSDMTNFRNCPSISVSNSYFENFWKLSIKTSLWSPF